MTHFAVSVRDEMMTPVESAGEDETLEAVLARLERLDISALPVLNGQGKIAGIITRTDLLRAGRVRVVGERRERLVSMPASRVREHMSSTVEFIQQDSAMNEAAARMVKHHYHRIVVAQDERPVGIVGTREMMGLVAKARVTRPVGDLMTKGVVEVKADDPLSLAVDRMAAAHVAGLVVVDEGWPVGIFTQTEALEARDAKPEERAEGWMNARFVCLPSDMPVHRAATQALATRSRRVLVLDGREIRGIVSGMDFARLVADAA